MQVQGVWTAICGVDRESPRSLGERVQEHDTLVKAGYSKSALSHQMKMGHKVLSKPMIEGVRVIDN